MGSGASMIASMIMMYLGLNVGIVIFFVAIPVLLFGVLTAQTAKERVNYAIDTDTKPIPVFWHIKYAVLATGEFISRKGLWRFIFTVLAVISLIVTLVFGAICGHFYLERQDIERNIDYMKYESLYNEKYTEWLEYKASGDEESAHQTFEEMEKYHFNNAEGKRQITEFSERLNEFGLYAGISGIVTAFFVAVLAVYITVTRISEKSTESI